MSQALAAIKLARVFLNDINGLTWSEAILMPYLQAAFQELIQDLDVNSIGVLKYETPPILIPTGSLDMGNNQPSNILEPIAMLERVPYTDQESFVDMYKVNFLPHVDQSAYLTWWCFNAETIQFVGASTDVEVVLRYKGSLTIPQLLTDPIGVIYGENYLGPRMAALAYDSMGKDSAKLNEAAQNNLYKLIQRNVLSNQTPVRRRSYRSPKSTLGQVGMVALTVPQGGGGSGVLTWIPTNTAPDGIRTSFIFPKIPNFVSWNGTNQFSGAGYTLSVISGQYTVVFKDVNGATLTPQVGDDIREAVNL